MPRRSRLASHEDQLLDVDWNMLTLTLKFAVEISVAKALSSGLPQTANTIG